MTRRIGIDVGGVIIDSIHNDNSDTSFLGDNFLRTTAVPSSFYAVRKLVQRFGADNVFIVSKCGPVIQEKTLGWLVHQDFKEFTGFLPHNLYFCLTRAEKAPIVQTLGITDFVDDHREVLEYMDGIVDRRYLFGPQPSAAPIPDGIIAVRNWDHTLMLILP